MNDTHKVLPAVVAAAGGTFGAATRRSSSGWPLRRTVKKNPWTRVPPWLVISPAWLRGGVVLS